MKFSDEASAILDATGVYRLTQDDVPEGFREVVAGGWLSDDGAMLLRRFRDSYFGDRARFTDILGYEIAVNGRGVPDLDITVGGRDRARLLLRRGLAMAWSALHEASRSFPKVTVFGYVSVSPTLMDPDDWTGNVTFSSGENAQPYFDIETAPGIIVLLDSKECSYALPAAN
jgi:hypothetical protein